MVLEGAASFNKCVIGRNAENLRLGVEVLAHGFVPLVLVGPGTRFGGRSHGCTLHARVLRRRSNKYVKLLDTSGLNHLLLAQPWQSQIMEVHVALRRR